MKPVLQALVLAERVYTDTPSGKKIIAGTFNRLLIGRVQAQQVDLPEGGKGLVVPGGTDMGSPWAYISLTDVVDGTDINLQFMNIGKNQLLFQIAIKISSKDRLATVEIVAPLPPISTFCNEAGTYSLDVVWGNEILGSHRLVVAEIGQPT
jgi:hypothetical protein